MALDQCHEQVLRAFQKDGWGTSVTPYRVISEDRQVYIDLRATRQVNGSREQILLVEVKCFADRNALTRDLYTAIGQYILYRAMLEYTGQIIPLYLAVPENVYRGVFDAVVHHAINKSKIALVIVNLDTEMIVQWIK